MLPGTPPTDALAWIAAELRAGRLAPAELAEALYRLENVRPAEMARALGLSTSHVRNLVRLRRQLCPFAWARAREEGERLVVGRWLILAALPPAEQEAHLTSQIPARRPHPRMIARRLGQLPPSDVRGRVLAWVLGRGPFPAGRLHQSDASLACGGVLFLALGPP